jgi:hypothetical protein
MPNPTYRVSIVSKKKDQSSIGHAAYNSGSKLLAAAAYRAGEKLYDPSAGVVFDYTLKEDVRHSEIIAPENAPLWARDRSSLHLTAEAAEKRKDAQLARAFIIALPRELTLEQNIALMREYVIQEFVSKGLVVDLNIHDKLASDGQTNPHAHLLVTMREISSDGFAKKKNPAWNAPYMVSVWRNAWETMQNDHLEAAGRSERISLKSYKDQGINRIPQSHMGVEGQLEKRTKKETKKGNKNREIIQNNAVREVLEDNAPVYSQKEIEDYYQRVYAREETLYEPDLAALKQERDQEVKKPQEYETYAARVTVKHWFGLGGVTDTIYQPGRGRIHIPIEDMTNSQRHESQLRYYLQNAAETYMRDMAEHVNRLKTYVNGKVDQAFEYGRDIAERSRTWKERTQMDQGQERER